MFLGEIIKLSILQREIAINKSPKGRFVTLEPSFESGYQYFFDEPTPNFELGSNDENQSPTLNRKFSLEQMKNTSNLERFRSTPRRSLVCNFKNTDEYKFGPGNTMSSKKHEPFQERCENIPDFIPQEDFHIYSNNRKKRNLSKSKVQIDSIFNRLNELSDETPDEMENTITSKSYSYSFKKPFYPTFYEYEPVFIDSNREGKVNFSSTKRSFESSPKNSSSIKGKEPFLYKLNEYEETTEKKNDDFRSKLTELKITPDKSRNDLEETKNLSATGSKSGIPFTPEGNSLNTSSISKSSLKVIKKSKL